MIEILLLKPYSIWSSKISNDSRNGNYIAKFFQENGIWKEFKDAPFGISQEQMNNLLIAKYAIKLNK